VSRRDSAETFHSLHNAELEFFSSWPQKAFPERRTHNAPLFLFIPYRNRCRIERKVLQALVASLRRMGEIRTLCTLRCYRRHPRRAHQTWLCFFTGNNNSDRWEKEPLPALYCMTAPPLIDRPLVAASQSLSRPLAFRRAVRLRQLSCFRIQHS